MSAASASIGAEDLRARRQRLGLSQQAVAVAAGCSLSFVRWLEAGYSPARSPTRDRVLSALHEFERERAAA